MDAEHICLKTDNGDWLTCIDGKIYGPCDDEHCNGVCEMYYSCKCECHDGTAE